MSSHTASVNPFALIMDPGAVRQRIERSEQLRQLKQRQCHPLDKAVIRSASAELAAFDARIDRHTVYLAPGAEQAAPPMRLPRLAG